jgi:hypothetical protein
LHAARGKVGPRRIGAALLGLAAGAGLAASCAESGTIERSRQQEMQDQQPQQYRGQSGSEYNPPPAGADPVACPCAGFGSRPLLRVTLLERSTEPHVTGDFRYCTPNFSPPTNPYEFEPGIPLICERLKLRVEEVLHGETPLQPGDEIVADSDGYLPCFRGVSAVATEAQAFAVAQWKPPPLPACAERDACYDQCARDIYGPTPPSCPPDAGTKPDSCWLPECAGACGGFDDVCPPPREPSAEELRERWSVKLAPWDESIVFARTEAASLRVPVCQLPLIWSEGGQCFQRFGNWSELLGAWGKAGPPAGG